MATVLEPQAKRWTYEEYYRLDDDKRYEIIDGELLLTAPSPDTWHQNWVRSLFRILDKHVAARALGEVMLSPLDVIFSENNTAQPDLIFIAQQNLGIVQKCGIFGAPDLLVEIISPSSVHRDRHRKFKLYARFGVKEYWIADPANQSLEVHALKEGAYELHCCAAEKGPVTSPLLPGLEFNVADL